MKKKTLDSCAKASVQTADALSARKRSADDVLRKCIVSGELLPKSAMIRFCVSPDGKIVPDLAGVLPAKGIWVTADRDLLAQAVEKKLFNKAARRRKDICPPDLPQTVERLLFRRCLDALGVAKRSGLVVAGFEKVAEAVRKGNVLCLLEAVDAADDGSEKIRRIAKDLPVLSVFSASDAGGALGRDKCVHAALKRGGAAQSFLSQVRRYASFCHLSTEDVPPSLFCNEA